MKRIDSAVAALVLVLGLALHAGQARAASLDKEFDCESWKGGAELRCLFNDGRGGPTASVDVANGGTEKVAFDADEYHSVCDVSSKQHDSSPYVASPGSKVTLNVLCPGRGITCREVFIVNCRVNGVVKQCTEVLSAKGRTWKGNKP